MSKTPNLEKIKELANDMNEELENINEVLSTVVSIMSQKKELVGTEYVLVASIIENIYRRLDKLQNHHLDLILRELSE